MKLHSQGHDGMQHITPHEWGSTLRVRSFHVEFPEDEETPVTHTLSFQRDFVRRDGGLNLEHRFRRSGGYVEFLINDRFHAILALRWLPLVALVFITVVMCAAVLSLILFLATGANANECLGSSNSNWDYFFFVVETMFAIGYGSPSFMVTPIVVTGVLLNSLILGLVFQKFSSAARRKWALAFTQRLVVSSGFVVNGSNSPASTHQRTVSGSSMHYPSGAPSAPLHEPLLVGIREDESSSPNASDHASQSSEDKDMHQCQGNIPSHTYLARPSSDSVLIKSNEDAPKCESREGLRISFRMLNITETSFFNTKLALFFLVHRRGGLSIRQFSMFHTDTPLEFMALPITVTVDQRDVGSPLRDITEADLRNHGECYELLALLSFTDNRTSRTVEVSRSWRLNTAVWDENFVPIVRQSGPGSSLRVHKRRFLEAVTIFYTSLKLNDDLNLVVVITRRSIRNRRRQPEHYSGLQLSRKNHQTPAIRRRFFGSTSRCGRLALLQHKPCELLSADGAVSGEVQLDLQL
ncbi:hypothetical protein, conserved [Eimeria acervulina]|uniref:Inward rectifier potassium channel C-terminal domain-containing protein n=1 Tax=Eimeria acervulina TaxID=5801 RepID=U6GL40_EIMAC|nr:hypothetical protein, conserved [Eimeria acervulina]CDI80890.1 hypothetical protein, conserved [Eimeria acervulina]